MTEEEFLLSQTRDVIEIFEKYGSYSPTFAILYDDGNVDSFATCLTDLNCKKNFDFFMRKMCENPKVIASIFTFEGWISKLSAKGNKRPSECSDRETIVCVLYSTRDNIQEIHSYKPDSSGKLELVDIKNMPEGLFCKPFDTSA
jgi:hypothetical protein